MVPFLVKPLAYIQHANTLNRELSQSCVFQGFCLVFKQIKFSKQFLMAAGCFRYQMLMDSLVYDD